VTAEVTEPFAAELTGHLAHVLATGAAAAAAAERLRTGLDPLPALATARDAGCCCKAHRSWQALLQLQTAVGLLQQGDRQAAHGAVLHAVSIEPHFAATLKVAGEIAQLLGQDGSSGRELDTAVWFLADPEVRGQTAARAALAMSRLQSPRPGPRLRADAAASMTSGDLDSAAALLRAARELEPDVEADLLLRRRLCLLRADPRGALGASLLLREYAPSLLAQQHLQRDYAAVGYRDLADRLAGSGPEHAVGRRTSPSDLAPAVTATAGAAPAAPGR
jgi:hypothetical protein